MFSIRALAYGPALLLAGLMALSFASVERGSERRRNELTVANIADAENLNPILSTTATEYSVSRLVFNGLLKHDANLEIVGDLAKSWEQRQTSHGFFVNPLDARQALEALEKAKDEWEQWKLVAAEIDGPEERELVLHFSEPGAANSGAVLEQLQTEKMEPLATIRVDVKTSARESAAHFLATSAHASQIIRSWTGGSLSYELTVRGDRESLIEELEAYYRANESLEPAVTIEKTAYLLDEPELLFLLHENIRWHDGAPFTAEDVAFTYRMIMDDAIASPRKADYSLVRSVEVLAADSLKVVYRRPYSPALQSWLIGILPRHILENRPLGWWSENFNRKPIGTGPFMFGDWRTNEFLRLVKNPGYFEGAPHLDAILFRTIPDPVAIRLAFETHQIDFWNVPPHAVAGAEENPHYEIFSRPLAGFTFLGWNLKNPLFEDVKVREALAHAVNVEGLIDSLMYGRGQRSDGTFPPQLWFHSDAVQTYAFDPEKAGTLLKEARWKPGKDGILEKDGKRFAFDLITNQGNDIRKDIATLVQSDLRQVGIEVSVQVYESAVFFAKFVMPHEFDACVLGWDDILTYDLYQIWHSSQTEPGELNFVSYQNPDLDKILEQIRGEYDRETIRKLAAEIQRITYRDQPYLFLYVPTVTTAMWKDSFRVLRPFAGAWQDEPVLLTQVGFDHYLPWFYRPEFPPAAASPTPAPAATP